MGIKYFMLKYNFYEVNIKQHAIVELITIINTACLIEDINTKKRQWVMKNDIYPLTEHDNYGDWSYNDSFQQLVRCKNK
jgi:hypothetical protein